MQSRRKKSYESRCTYECWKFEFCLQHAPIPFPHTFPHILQYTCQKNMQNPARKKKQSAEAVMNSAERSWGLIDL